jgi:hypothetical protein
VNIAKIHERLVEFHTKASEEEAQLPMYICLLSRETLERRREKDGSARRQLDPIGKRLRQFFESLDDELKAKIEQATICLSWETTQKGDPPYPSTYVQPKHCRGEYFFAYRWKRADNGNEEIYELTNPMTLGKKLEADEEFEAPKIRCAENLFAALAECDLIQPYVLNDNTRDQRDHVKEYEVGFLRDLFALEGTLEEKKEKFDGLVGPRLKEASIYGKFYQFTIFGYKLAPDASAIRDFVNPAKAFRDENYYKNPGRWLHMAFILFVLQWNTSLVTANAEVLREREDRIPFLPPEERANVDAVLRPYYKWR